MALDYKQLQTSGTGQAMTTDAYCPECGRPWRDPSPVRPSSEAVFPWRAALLAVVGLALALSFGVRAARVSQTGAATQSGLAVLPWCGGGETSALGCPPAEDQELWLRVDYANHDEVRRQQGLAFVSTVLGLLALGVGLSGVARRRQDRPRTLLATLGGLGESLLALTCLQILVLTLYSIAAQLSGGLPLTWETLDRATGEIVVLLATAARP
jgi:hypothetical protein